MEEIGPDTLNVMKALKQTLDPKYVKNCADEWYMSRH